MQFYHSLICRHCLRVLYFFKITMKRRYNNDSDSYPPPPQSKRRLDPRQFVADHYSARTNQSRQEREASPIIHLKKLNNWIKSVLIQLSPHQGHSVLDLACGKGGDLIKWSKAKIGYYVGIDIAHGSIEDCRTRYNGNLNQFNFPARLVCGDGFGVGLRRVLERDNGLFDICSCQFALHYSWSSETRARQALANVSELLRPGGSFIGTMPDADVIMERLERVKEVGGSKFGNSVYSICFDDVDDAIDRFKSSAPFGIKYMFHLEDAVDCPEWLVPFHAFESLADEYGLELVLKENAHSFVEKYLKEPNFVNLARIIGCLGDERNKTTNLTKEEWEVAKLYSAFVLRKRGQLDGNRKNNDRWNPRKTYISRNDILFLSGNE